MLPLAERADRQPGSGAMLPRPFRVVDRRQDTADTVTVWLEPADGVPLPFSAGQFTMLSAFGVGEVPVSVSGDPHVAGPLQHTIRDVGGVTHVLTGAAVGDVVGVRGPFGTGWDMANARGGDVVVMAGGIGLAPLRPAVVEMLSRREEYGRVVVLYGARTPEDLLYVAEQAQWVREGVEVLVAVDRASPAWRGRVGLVTALLEQARLDPARTSALVCGPEVMMRHGAAALTGLGVRPDRVRVSLERNMRCGVGLCGHCQYRELFVCVDGPVLPYDRVRSLLGQREV